MPCGTSSGEGSAGGGGRGGALEAVAGTAVGGLSSSVVDGVVAPGEWRVTARGGGAARRQRGVAAGTGGDVGGRSVGEPDCGVGASVVPAEGDAFERCPAPVRRSQRAASAAFVAAPSGPATGPGGAVAHAAQVAGGTYRDRGTGGAGHGLRALRTGVGRPRLGRVRVDRDPGRGVQAAYPPSAVSASMRLRRSGHGAGPARGALVSAHRVWDFGVDDGVVGTLGGAASVSTDRPLDDAPRLGDLPGYAVRSSGRPVAVVRTAVGGDSRPPGHRAGLAGRRDLVAGAATTARWRVRARLALGGSKSRRGVVSHRPAAQPARRR